MNAFAIAKFFAHHDHMLVFNMWRYKTDEPMAYEALFGACRASEVARAGNDPLQHALNWVRRNWPKQYRE